MATGWNGESFASFVVGGDGGEVIEGYTPTAGSWTKRLPSGQNV